jgi:hypothetical protein
LRVSGVARQSRIKRDKVVIEQNKRRAAAMPGAGERFCPAAPAQQARPAPFAISQRGRLRKLDEFAADKRAVGPKGESLSRRRD